jgi:hypothetical protein
MTHCIRSLELPFLLQVVKILSSRVRASSCRSSLVRWLTAILHHRGYEMHRVERSHKAEIGEGCGAAPQTDVKGPSSPRVFIAPLLAHFRHAVEQYDVVATAYGRLSVFAAIQPRQEESGRPHPGRPTVTFPMRFKLIHATQEEPLKVIRLRESASRRKGPRRDAATSRADVASITGEQHDALSLSDGSDGKLKKRPKKQRVEDLIADGSGIEDEEGPEHVDFDEASDDAVGTPSSSEGDSDDEDDALEEEELEDDEGPEEERLPEQLEESDEESEGLPQSNDDGDDMQDLIRQGADPRRRRARTD